VHSARNCAPILYYLALVLGHKPHQSVLVILAISYLVLVLTKISPPKRTSYVTALVLC